MNQDPQSKPLKEPLPGAPRPAEPDGPDTWTADKRAEVERMGAEATTSLLRRASNPGPLRPPRAAPAFVVTMSRCDAHGEYAANELGPDGVERWHPPGCPTCARQAAAEKLMARAAISPRFTECTFGNFRAETPKQREALDLCRQYAAEFGKNREAGTCLILRGNPGTGKNHLATAIAKAVMVGGHTVLNATAFEVIRRIRETWGARAIESEADVIRKFGELDLLIVDEIGRHYQAKDGSESIEIFNVIDERYRLVRPTIVISNLDKEELQRAMGKAAYDRLRQGGAKIANFDWDSARG
jgi:DNA replication protein DnaC